MNGRKGIRVSYRKPFSFHCEKTGQHHTCEIRNISENGIFTIDSLCFSQNDIVTINILHGENQSLPLSCKVIRVTPGGCGLQFVNKSPTTLRFLKQVLNPEWDGENPLDGLLALAPMLQQSQSLADWLRLTSLMCNWRQNLHSHSS